MKKRVPQYHANTHYLDITTSRYFFALTKLRHSIRLASDEFWSKKIGAFSVDLFMLTPSVSSPMGPSSDSLSIPMKLGKLKTFLVDSAQFGLEPLLINRFKAVYCYLPSMRGEDPDEQHLNQFYHCEAEIKCKLDELIPVVENYIKFLLKTIRSSPEIVKSISNAPQVTLKMINIVVQEKKFKLISFDEAVQILKDNGFQKYIGYSKYGRYFKKGAEIIVADLLKYNKPFWIYGYDRDQVPFYQKSTHFPQLKALNADLIVPPLIPGSFGGEIAGSGQRQDTKREMVDALRRQHIDATPYEWYMNLRTLPNYRPTSGFGLGIERFITWIMAGDNIRDAILYPRLKNIKTYP